MHLDFRQLARLTKRLTKRLAKRLTQTLQKKRQLLIFTFVTHALLRFSYSLEFRYRKLSSLVLLLRDELDPSLSFSTSSDLTGEAFLLMVSSISCLAYLKQQIKSNIRIIFIDNRKYWLTLFCPPLVLLFARVSPWHRGLLQPTQKAWVQGFTKKESSSSIGKQRFGRLMQAVKQVIFVSIQRQAVQSQFTFQIITNLKYFWSKHLMKGYFLDL